MASGSEKGKLIDSYTSKGNLVPLEIVVQTIVDAISNAPKDIVIIDGYPRSVEQMLELDKILKGTNNITLANAIDV